MKIDLNCIVHLVQLNSADLLGNNQRLYDQHDVNAEVWHKTLTTNCLKLSLTEQQTNNKLLTNRDCYDYINFSIF